MKLIALLLIHNDCFNSDKWISFYEKLIKLQKENNNLNLKKIRQIK